MEHDLPSKEEIDARALHQLVLELIKLGHSEEEALKIAHGVEDLKEEELIVILQQVTQTTRPKLEELKRHQVIDKASLDVIDDILNRLEGIAPPKDTFN
jgi:hypothetical protein